MLGDKYGDKFNTMFYDRNLDEYLHNRDADGDLPDTVPGDGGRGRCDFGRYQDRALDGGSRGDGVFGIRRILRRVSASKSGRTRNYRNNHCGCDERERD